MSVFLRGARVEILAPDACDAAFLAERAPWLLGDAALPPDPEDEGEISAVWGPHRGDAQGSLAFARIDWTRRQAWLVGTLAPDADRALASEALALWLRYARDELGLERLDARVPAHDAPARALLRALGFVEAGAPTEPVGVVLCSRSESLSPREGLPP